MTETELELEVNTYRNEIHASFFLSEPQLDLCCQGYRDGLKKREARIQELEWEEITKKYGVSQVAIFYRLNPKMKNKRNDYNKNYNKLPKRKTEKMKEYIANSVKNTYRYKKELCARGLL